MKNKEISRNRISFNRQTGQVILRPETTKKVIDCRKCGSRTTGACSSCKEELVRPSFMGMVEDALNGLSFHLDMPSAFPVVGKTITNSQSARFDMILEKRGGLFCDTLSTDPLRYQVNPSAVGGQKSVRWVAQLLIKDLLLNYTDLKVTLAVIVPGEKTLIGDENLRIEGQEFEYRFKFLDDSLYSGRGSLQFGTLENRTVISYVKLQKGNVVQEAIDDSTSHRYISGECHYLAVALHRLYGYQMEVLWDEDPPEAYSGQWPEGEMALTHVYCLSPNSDLRIIDINGVRSKVRMLIDFEVNSPYFEKVNEAQLKKSLKLGRELEEYRIKDAINLVKKNKSLFLPSNKKKSVGP